MLGNDDSIQFNDDEDQGFSEGGERKDSKTNRPAANAHLSSSTEAMTEDFDVRDDADDFLGLEDEVEALAGAATDALASGADIALGDDGQLQLSDGWLLEIPVDDDDDVGLTTSLPTRRAPGEHGHGDHAVDEGDYDAEYDELSDEELLLEGEELEDHDEHELTAAPSLSRRLALVGFCAGVLGAGSLMFFRGDGKDAPTELANRSAPAPSATTTPVATTTVPGTTTTPTNGTDPAPTGEIVDAGPTGNPLDGLLSGGAPTGAPEIVALDPIASPGGVTPTPDVIDIADLPHLDSRGSEQSRVPGSSRSLLVRLEDAVESGEVASFMPFHPTETGLIWTGTEVPSDAIAQPGRLLTPGVGIVRATMASGELFEGNLYAVGSNRVWIELGPGRVGLDGGHVSRIERIVLSPDVDPNSVEAIPGQRVRIRTEGGVLYGKVKTRDGDRVTIVTDKGARITLDNPVIEPIGRASGLVLKP
jgi:hypothetical protein